MQGYCRANVKHQSVSAKITLGYSNDDDCLKALLGGGVKDVPLAKYYGKTVRERELFKRIYSYSTPSTNGLSNSPSSFSFSILSLGNLTRSRATKPPGY